MKTPEERIAELEARESALRRAVEALDERMARKQEGLQAGPAQVGVASIRGWCRAVLDSHPTGTPEDTPPFVRKIEVPGERVDGLDLRLSREQQAELDEQLEAIAEARRSAMRQAHDHVIGAATPTDQTAPVPPPEAVEAVGTAWLAHGTCAPTDPARPRSRRCACGEVLPSRSEWAWHRDRAIAAAVVAALDLPAREREAAAKAELDLLTETRTEWGVMFHDGSVRYDFNGRTARERATEAVEDLRAMYPGDNIRLVSRRVYVTPWREVTE